jgi:hypothetical protein
VEKRLSPSGPKSPVFQTSLVVALVAFGIYFDHVAAVMPAPENVAALHARLARERAAPEVQEVAQWAVASQDHAGLPFVVVDKTQARLFAFDPQGQLLGSTAILSSRPQGVPTPVAAAPTGRFVTDTGLSAHADGIVWVNAGIGFSVYGTPAGQDAGFAPQPWASGDGDNQAVADGTLRVAGDFYREHLSNLKSQVSVAYVLSQGQPWHEVLGNYMPADGRRQLTLARSSGRETGRLL